MVHQSVRKKIQPYCSWCGRRSKSSKTAGNNDFSVLIVFCELKKNSVLFSGPTCHHMVYQSASKNAYSSWCERRSKSKKPAGNNDFSLLIVFCEYKKIVFHFLSLHIIAWYAEVLGTKYRLIPADAEDGQNRQKPLETTISQF